MNAGLFACKANTLPLSYAPNRSEKVMGLKIDVVGSRRLELERKYEWFVLSEVGLLGCIVRMGIKSYIDYLLDSINPTVIA